MSVTIKDVAKRANVSIATVSRVLNNSNIVEEETKKRVQEAVRELSYLPNNLGRSDYTISEYHKFEYSGKVFVL
ncbi:MAG: LacI family DNA-binding transcriptional regulator, partial [Bacteroidota bacterium]|nr:LacI family DNA-binding transcriptional regulator [Bacteroidota bacterium]